MGLDLFYYTFTFVVVLICTAGSSISIASWYISKRKIYILTAILLVLYSIDLLLIFGNEYIYKIPNLSFFDFYAIYNSEIRTLLATLILECAWMILLVYCDLLRIDRIVLPGIIFFTVSEVTLSLSGSSPLEQWLYYFYRICFLGFILIYGFMIYLKTDNGALKKRLAGKRWAWFGLIVATSCICLEDTYFILIFDPSAHTNSALVLLYISERNISECIAIVVFTFFAIRSAIRYLRARYIEPRKPQTNAIPPFMQESLESYCAHHNLTKREKEVLAQILEGKTNNEIATNFVLSIGTIKTHVHSILHKTNSANREDLCNSFWSE